MQPVPLQQSRINLSDLKSQIVKKLGPKRAHWYFNHLNRLLSHKLSKPEFNKLCISTLGRENVTLHNQLIRSILRNAFHAKTPPHVTHDTSFVKSAKDGWSHLSNGETLPLSPCKSRSHRDHPSPLGPSGREAGIHQSLVAPCEVVVQQDGDWSSCVLKRLVQHHQSSSAERLAKRQRTEKLLQHDQVSVPVHSKSLVELVAVENQQDVGRKEELKHIRGPLQAPLGIPFCAASVGGARRSLPLNTSSSTISSITSYDCGELCNTEDLKTRMEKIAQGQGLGGVTINCANLLNCGLDAYLKELIRSSIELVRARIGLELLKHPLSKQLSQGKPINGSWQGSHIYVQNNVGPLEATHKQENHCLISLQDIKVAMGLNPHQLREDWPLFMEKICLHSFEE